MSSVPPPNYTNYPRPNYSRGPGIRFDVIGEAITLFQANWSAWVVGSLPFLFLNLVSVVLSVLSFFASDLGAAAEAGFSLVSIAFYMVYMFVYYGLLAGLIQMGIKQIRGQTVRASDAFNLNGQGLNIFASIFLLGILTVLGFCACIVPGFLVLGLGMFTFPIITDQGLNPVEAFKKSYDTIKPYMWSAVALYFVLNLLAGISIYFCLVGTLVGMPILALGVARSYADFFLQPQGYPAYGEYR